MNKFFENTLQVALFTSIIWLMGMYALLIDFHFIEKFNQWSFIPLV